MPKQRNQPNPTKHEETSNSSATQVITKKSKKKRKKKADPNWRRETSKKHANNNKTSSAFDLRSDHKKEVEDANGNKQPFKSTFLINADVANPSFLSPSKETSTQAKLIQAFKENISSFRPAKQILIDTLPTTSTPPKVITPNGTTLGLRMRMGLGAFYTNDPSNSPSSDKQLSSSLHTEKTKINTNIHTASLTKKQLQSVKNQRQATHGQRPASQESIMGESAKNHFTAKGYDITNAPVELLHVIADSFIGDAGSVKTNLFAGTAAANTAMILPENQVRHLINSHEKVDLNVRVDLFEGSQIAQGLQYQIKAGNDYVLPFTINPLSTIKPHAHFNTYFKNLTDVLETQKKQTNTSQAITTTQQTPPITPSLLFYRNPHPTNAVVNDQSHNNQTRPLATPADHTDCVRLK